MNAHALNITASWFFLAGSIAFLIANIWGK